MKYGVRDIVDVVLRAKGTMDLGNKRFYKDEPVLYFDTLTTSTLEGAATTVYAQGGRGNARLMAWEGERTVTFTMEDALISPESLSILTGAGLMEATEDAPIHQHIVETSSLEEDALSGTGDSAVLTLSLNKKPFFKKDGNYAFVMITKDGEVISEPYVIDQNTEPVKNEDGTYTVVVNAHDCNFGENCHDEGDKKYHVVNLDADVKAGNGVLVDYYTAITSGAKQIEIDAEKFAGNFYLEASTLWKDEKGLDHPAEFIIPNCKIQSNFTFTMAASGDPSTFTFTMDAFPDYTKFDKSHKVFFDIQVIESETTASDANTDLHRGKTWHDGVSYADAASGSSADNHDN